MKPLFLVAAALGAIGAIACAAVGVHEWMYYAGHPYRTGVSGVMAWLAFGAMAGCAGITVLGLGLAHRLK